MDTVSDDDRKEAATILISKNIPIGFLVAIINHERVISGYMPDEMNEALGI